MRVYQQLRGKCPIILERWPYIFHQVLQDLHHLLEPPGAPLKGDSRRSLWLMSDAERTLIGLQTGTTSNLEGCSAPCS